jgi:hypothetical protein
MRFFASLWDKISVREAAPALMAVMVGAGAFGFGFQFISSILGYSWN